MPAEKEGKKKQTTVAWWQIYYSLGQISLWWQLGIKLLCNQAEWEEGQRNNFGSTSACFML